jgi:hypothetical protein
MDTDWDSTLKHYEDSPRNESKYDVILVYKAGDSNIYMNYRRKFQFLSLTWKKLQYEDKTNTP